MSKITCYDELLEKIYDEKLKKTFIVLTKDYDIKNMTSEFLDLLNIFANVSFLKLENNLKIRLLSQPELWILYMYDKDFLAYIKDSWEDFKDLINNYNEEQLKEELKDNYEQFEYNKKNIQKLKIIINVFGEMYPELF
jgi:hypothetical protein